MFDKKLVLEILRQIEDASGKILHRFSSIQQVEDFTDNQAGVEKMDAICMINQTLTRIFKEEKNSREAMY